MRNFIGTTAIVTLLLAGSAAMGDSSVPAQLGAGENIRAAHVEDDGSGVLVISGARGASTLAFFDAKLAVTRMAVPGIALGDRIDRVGPPASGRFVATAFTGAEQLSYVLLERRANDVRVLWSSSNLQIARELEPHVSISPDGNLWAAVAEAGNRKLVVQLGQIPDAKPFLKIESTMTAEQSRGGSDNPIVTWIQSDRKNPLVAVQWLSAVHLFGSANGKTVRGTASAFPATGLRWQPSAGMLWVQQRGSWLGYSVDELRRAAQSRKSAASSRRVDPSAVRGRILAFEPLADGTVAIAAPPDAAGNRTIAIYGFTNDQPVKRAETSVERRSWRLSPSGRAVVSIPTSSAKAAYVQRIR